jgi:hypothetical protein
MKYSDIPTLLCVQFIHSKQIIRFLKIFNRELSIKTDVQFDFRFSRLWLRKYYVPGCDAVFIAYWLLDRLSFWPWRWRHNIPSKRLWTFTEPYTASNPFQKSRCFEKYFAVGDVIGWGTNKINNTNTISINGIEVTALPSPGFSLIVTHV